MFPFNSQLDKFMYQLCELNYGDQMCQDMIANLHNSVPCIPYLGWILGYIIRLQTYNKMVSSVQKDDDTETHPAITVKSKAVKVTIRDGSKTKTLTSGKMDDITFNENANQPSSTLNKKEDTDEPEEIVDVTASPEKLSTPLQCNTVVDENATQETNIDEGAIKETETEETVDKSDEMDTQSFTSSSDNHWPPPLEPIEPIPNTPIVNILFGVDLPPPPKEELSLNWIDDEPYNPFHAISPSSSWSSVDSVNTSTSDNLNNKEPLPEFQVTLAQDDQPGCSGWQLIKDTYDPKKGSFDQQLKIASARLAECVTLYWEKMDAEMKPQKKQGITTRKMSKYSSSSTKKGKERATSKGKSVKQFEYSQESCPLVIKDTSLQGRSRYSNYNETVDVLGLVQGFQRNTLLYGNHLKSRSEVSKVIESATWMDDDGCLYESMQRQPYIPEFSSTVHYFNIAMPKSTLF